MSYYLSHILFTTTSTKNLLLYSLYNIPEISFFHLMQDDVCEVWLQGWMSNDM